MIKNLIIILSLLSGSCQAQTMVAGIFDTAQAPVGIDYTNANLIADGNSYVQGNGYTPFSSYVINASPFNTNGATMQNFGVGGQTTGQMLTDQTSQVLSTYNSAVTNVVMAMEVGNDLYFNGSVDSAVARYKRYCNYAKAAGFYVIAYTTIHRNQTTSFGDNATQYNAKLDAANAAIIADTSFYDALIRMDLESIFSTYSAGGYDGDEVHPNQTGQNLIGSLTVQALQTLIP